MNKAELAKEIVKDVNPTITEGQATQVINAITGNIIDALSDGNNVTLLGFGTFTVRERQERTARNPRTGKRIQIESAIIPVFKPSKKFKEAMN